MASGRPEFRLFSDRRRHPARPKNLLPSPVPVRLRHPELADRLALEVEFDQYRSLITDNPAIMTGLDDHDLRSRELDSAAVCILDVDLAAAVIPTRRCGTNRRGRAAETSGAAALPMGERTVLAVVDLAANLGLGSLLRSG